MTCPKFSIIIPVKNEVDNLKKCLLSIQKLDYSGKTEVIIADGLSTDGTKDLIRKFKITLVDNRKQTVAPGRNRGFEVSSGEYIAFTDADCIPDKNWLSRSLKYFKDKKVAGVGGPNLTPQAETLFARAVGWVLNQPVFTAHSYHARTLKKVTPTLSLPGCNAIYKRCVLEQVMPQDETLLTCDETEMNYRINDLGYKLLYTPDVFVYHYRRPTPLKLLKQMYRYAIGRLQLGKKRKDGMNFIHILVGLSIPLFLLFNFAIVYFQINLLIPLFLAILLINLILFFKVLYQEKNIIIAFYVLIVVFIICSGWSIGFLRQLVFPLKDIRGH